MRNAKRLCSILLMFALLMTSMGWAGAADLAGKVRENETYIYTSPDDNQNYLEELDKDFILEDLKEDIPGWYVFTYPGLNGDVDAYIKVEDVLLTSDTGSGDDSGQGDGDQAGGDDDLTQDNTDDNLPVEEPPSDDDGITEDDGNTEDTGDDDGNTGDGDGNIDDDPSDDNVVQDDSNVQEEDPANQDGNIPQDVDPSGNDDNANNQDANSNDLNTDDNQGDNNQEQAGNDNTVDNSASNDNTADNSNVAGDQTTGDDNLLVTDTTDNVTTGDAAANNVPDTLDVTGAQSGTTADTADQLVSAQTYENTIAVPATLDAISTLAVGLGTEGLPPQNQQGKVSMSSNDQRLNLYSAMRLNSTVLASYPNDYIVRVISRHGDWTLVNTRDGNEGYMQTSFLAFWQNGEWVGGQNGTAKVYAYVNMNSTTARLNLRSGPGSTYSVIDSYLSGTRVEIRKWDAYWSEVRVEADGNIGYMQTQYLSLTWPPSGGGTQPPSGDYQYATVNNPDPRDWLNLRSYPSTTASVLGRYYNGKTVLVLNYGTSWCYVQVDGILGYMMTPYLYFGSSPSPGPSPSPSEYATVNNPNPNDRLNLRARPSTSSTSLGKYSNGTRVRILEYGTTWCQVEVAGLTGYMMTYYLSFGSSPSPTPTPVGYATVNNPGTRERLNLRARPTTSSTSLGQYYNGTRVTILEYGSTWCHVQVDGKTGYMMTYYLSFSSYQGTTPNPTVGVVNNPLSTQRLSLYAYASTSSQSLSSYYNGTIVSILEYGSSWCRVKVDGITGYMQTQYLTLR